ncbi:MAG TPA: glucosamine-6-phosphate deaminase [Verrucomicrobiae bacterium]
MPDATTAVDWAARQIIALIRAKPRATLGLGTALPLLPVIQQLVRAHQIDGLDFSRARIFVMDEAVPSPIQEISFTPGWLQEHFLERVNLDPDRIHAPNGRTSDLETECGRFEELIRRHGGIDLQLVDLGANGRIGYHEPPATAYSRTSIQTQVPDRGSPPLRVITMGLGTILESQSCLLLATGQALAGVVAQVMTGAVNPLIPATALHYHLHCHLVLDEAAAAQLPNRLATP